MKNVKLIGIALIGLIASSSAFAKDDGRNFKLLRSVAINTYLDALNGNYTKDLHLLFDDNLKSTTSTEHKTVNYSKSDILKELKGASDLVQNCKTSYAIVEDCPYQSIVKITMEYPSFIKVSYVNLNYTSTGWKISSITSHYD